MVRFINKNLKAHFYNKEEEIHELMENDSFNELTTLLTLHVKNLSNYSNSKLIHLLQKLKIQLGINKPVDFNFVLSSQRTRVKDLFLTLEIILETFHKIRQSSPEYFDDFVDDINEFFLINKIPVQIRYFPKRTEFYMEKIISPEVSEKIKETLENFSDREKVFEDFKNAIKEFSSGNYPESIKLCCKSIEDYLCILLKKESCQSIASYYKQASKKLKIPDDLNSKFINLINYIHKYRSVDSHGRLENTEIKEIELVNETIIQFTMAILNYLKKKNEKS